MCAVSSVFFILVKMGLDFEMWYSNLNSENATHKMHYVTSIALNVNAMLISIAAKMHQFRIMICHLRRYILFWIDFYCNCKKGTCLSGPCNDGKCCRRFITLSLYQASYKPESTNLWYEHIRTQIYLISSYLFNPSNFDGKLFLRS